MVITMAERDGGSSALLAFLLGAGIGTVAGLLLAPAPGEETRRRLRYLAEEFSERAGEGSKRLRAWAEEYAPMVRETFAESRERIAAAVDAGQRAFREEGDDILQ